MSDYQWFIQKIKQKTSIDLSNYKETQMKRRLISLRDQHSCDDFHTFFKKMCEDEKVFHAFLDRMTINVSGFYRNLNRWQVFEEKMLPSLLEKRDRLKIWSAACSTGEEPYTLAMILSRYLSLSDVSILATDLDENVLQRAEAGVYPERSLQEVPESMKNKFFTKEELGFKIDPSLKQSIKFEKHNLLVDRYETGFDLIVCRNVLIYFTGEAKESLYRKFSAALRPNGCLFVGSTEQIFSPERYQLTSEDTFFYRKSQHATTS